jgi:hypothetical protein
VVNTPPRSRGDRVLQAALDAYARGWTPIPILPGEKRPATVGWQRTAYADIDAVRAAFSGASAGIGLLLGEPSNGLIDVDLDHPKALRAAPLILSSTAMTTGRASTRRSHFWYIVNDGETPYRKYLNAEGSTLVELRSTGQTVIPPSVHPSGEPYMWEGDPWGGEDGPLVVSGKLLRARVAALALVAVLADAWPMRGSRHDAFLALAGALLRNADEETEDPVSALWESQAPHVIRVLAEVTHDADGAEARVREVVGSTASRLRTRRRVQGWPTLAGLIGDDAVKRAREAVGDIHEVHGLPRSVTEGTPSKSGGSIGSQGEDGMMTVLDVDDKGPLCLNDPECVRARFPRLDLAALVDPDRPRREWVVESLLPASTSVSVVGPAGRGKSLFVLAACIAIARGDAQFAGMPVTRRCVLYIDMENPVDDLAERLTALGLTPENVAEVSDLNVIHLPPLSPLDAATGGTEVAALVDAYGLSPGDVVVLDSTQRVTSGKENDADTMRDFYRHTGIMLKRRGLTVIRTDNTGKDPEKGARGSSGKRDDVELEWLLLSDQRDPDVFTLKQGKARLSGARDGITLARRSAFGVLTFVPAKGSYSERLAEVRNLFRRLGLPYDVSKRAAWKAVNDAREEAEREGEPFPGGVTRDLVHKAVDDYLPMPLMTNDDDDETDALDDDTDESGSEVAE